MSKSLVESLNEIKSMNATTTVKRRLLVECGLPATEASILIAHWRDEARRNAPVASTTTSTRPTFNLTFGVEIECLCAQSRYSQTFRNNGVPQQYRGYTHEHTDYYKFVTDSSVHGNNPIECVSPILRGADGFKSLELCCKSLNEAEASVNSTCGLHVHIGANDLTTEAYIRVFKNYQKLEGIIDTFMAESRRGNNSQWCRSLRNFDYRYATCKEDVYSIMQSRYFKVNPLAWRGHKTIEFRQHAGTTNFKKISAWVRFCGKLVEWSKEHEIENVNSIDEIPFLTKAEKTYFKSRVNELSAQVA